MLSVDGDADAAVETRIRIGWKKFRQLVPLLTNKDISLTVRGRLYSSCVQSSMLHGSKKVKSRLVLTFLVLPFWYLLTRVVPDIFQNSSKMVVCVYVLRQFFLIPATFSYLFEFHMFFCSGKLLSIYCICHFFLMQFCPIIFSFQCILHKAVMPKNMSRPATSLMLDRWYPSYFWFHALFGILPQLLPLPSNRQRQSYDVCGGC